MKRLVRGLLTGLVRLYYPTITVEGGERVPPAGSPVLFVLNHPNGLLDPLVLRLALGQPVRFLGKSTLFGNPLGRLAMEAFGALPVYRHRDKDQGGGDPARNEETFARCRAALAAGEWLALFPEGTTHSDPQLKPLKTGAARIALSTLTEHGETVDLQVVPVGLQYDQKAVFRSRALVVVGEPMPVRDYLAAYRADDHAGVTALTEAIRAALDTVVLQADTREMLEGIARVAVWTSDRPDARDDLAAQHRRARELLSAYQRLHAQDPARVEGIVAAARKYIRVLRALGVSDPWALEAETVKPAAVAVAMARAAVLAPPAAVGAALGWIPYRLAGRVAGHMAREEDVLGTTKLLAGALFMPLAWGIEAAVAGAVLGLPWALVVLAAGPVTGYAALRFDEQAGALAEGARYLWIRGRHATVARGLAARRGALATAVSEALQGG